MRSVSTLAALALVTAATISPVRAAGEFSSGNWRGGVVFQGGKFVQCNMWAPYINNWDLMFAMTQSGDFRLGLRYQKLDLTWSSIFGEKLGARLQLDDNPVVIKAFTATSATVVSTSISNLDWGKALRTGKVLRVHTGSRVRRFPLAGIDPALSLLSACVAKHRTA